jgi:RNA polymerase-binding transcription factor DksA
MTPTVVKRYRETLLSLGRRLNDNFEKISDEALRQTGGEASGGLSNVPLHTADLGTDHSEREVALTLMETEGQILNQIRSALERIDRGTFGACEACGRAITQERLKAIPYTPHCLSCAQQLEESMAAP